MRTIPESEKKKKQYPLSEWLFFNYLKKADRGSLRLSMPDGSCRVLGDLSQKPVEMEINDKVFFRKCVLFGEIGFGEAYTDKDWSSDDLPGVLNWFFWNSTGSGTMSSSRTTLSPANFLGAVNRVRHKLRRNTKSNSRKNISQHYDISNEFYALMLDETMTYSSALFSASDDLEAGQTAKFDAICRKLDLQPHHRLLEIGCGWGAFAVYAAERYGCRVDAVTISEKQFEYAKERIENKGLEDYVDVRLCDYRLLEGRYDRIVSIEMAEALGHEYVDLFFRKCGELLDEQGLILIQCITMPDPYFERYISQTDWIQKHIFPGGCLLSHRQILNSLHRTGELMAWDVHSFGPDYARTLRLWRDNFKRNRGKAAAMGLDEAFLRKWEYYLVLCEISFEARYTNVAHFLISRPMNPALHRAGSSAAWNSRELAGRHGRL